MSGRRSRDKGARTERAIARLLQRQGMAAVKVSRAYQRGHDIVMPLVGRDLRVEVKARADGFRELYGWLDNRDVLIVKADRQEPLVVLRMSLAAEIAAEKKGLRCGTSKPCLAHATDELSPPSMFRHILAWVHFRRRHDYRGQAEDLIVLKRHAGAVTMYARGRDIEES